MKDDNLKDFFKNLGIKNFVIGNTDGEYETDWNYIPFDDIDRVVRSDVFTDGFSRLNCARPGSLVLHYRDLDRSNKCVFFGKIEHPFVVCGGVRYTFLYAMMHNGRYYLNTRIEKNGKKIEKIYSLSELRRMTNAVAAPKTIWEKIAKEIVSIF